MNMDREPRKVGWREFKLGEEKTKNVSFAEI